MGGIGINEQNGFVFDERKKKWVVKGHVVGGRGVRFPSENPTSRAARNGMGDGGGGGMIAGVVGRMRSADSAGTGSISAISEFTYGDVGMPRVATSSTGAGVAGTGKTGGNNMSLVSPPSPDSPEEQGVEVPIDGSGEEFVSNTNVERFLSLGDHHVSTDRDEMSVVTGFSGYTNMTPTARGSDAHSPSRRVVTPDGPSSFSRRVRRTNSASTSTTADDPGRIVPKARNVVANRLKIAEDTPFDEDIPFDERSRKTRSGSGGGGWGGTSNSTTNVPNMLDDMDDDDRSGGSADSANSEEVLSDLDKLSKFMMERKRSRKSQRINQSSRGGGSKSRTALGGRDGGGTRGKVGRMTSFGSRGI
jgi:hypothetical protein